MKKVKNKTEYTATQLAFAHFEALLITQVPSRWANAMIKEANREVGGDFMILFSDFTAPAQMV